MQNYELVKHIGRGSFGKVDLVRNIKENKEYVIKRIETADLNDKDRENIKNEVGILQKMRHPNIVAYKDCFIEEDSFNIVMAYCEEGDMYQKIRAPEQQGPFSEEVVLDWFAQLAFALHYLHDQKILHRDVKTQNIFLRKRRVVFGDFGIAKVLDSPKELAKTSIGTPYYMAPELFNYKPYSYKVDIWALGCIMYEIMNQKHAFDAQNLNGLAIKILKGDKIPLNSIYSKALRGLVDQMLSAKPRERPTIEEILTKPIIKKKLVAYIIRLHTGEQDTDLYLDTVKTQCQTLGIQDLVDKYLQKKIQRFSQSDFPNSGVSTVLGTSNPINAGTVDKQRLKQAKKDQESALKLALNEKEMLEGYIKQLEQFKSSKEYTSLSKKEQILMLKKFKKENEMQMKKDQLEDIRKSNQGSSLKAKQMKEKQYLDSHQVKNALKEGVYSGASQGNNLAEEDLYGFEDDDFADSGNYAANRETELGNIKEEEEESEEEQDLDESIRHYKTKHEKNSQNINKLQTELKKTTIKLNSAQDDDRELAEDSAVSISDIEGSEDGQTGDYTAEQEDLLSGRFLRKIQELES
jgi:serine/threonine protein kinase